MGVRCVCSEVVVSSICVLCVFISTSFLGLAVHDIFIHV